MWNPLRLDQKVERLPGGAIRVSPRIHNPKEFARHLLRFGEGVRISGEEELLAETRAFLGEMAAHYGVGV